MGHCKYTLPSLHKNILLTYNIVTLENIQTHFCNVRHYMFAYLEGLRPGNELDEALKKYKQHLNHTEKSVSMNNCIHLLLLTAVTFLFEAKNTS